MPMLTHLKSNCLLITYIRIRNFLMCFLAALFISACESEHTGPQLTGLTMGTSYSIQWTDNNLNIDQNALSSEVEARLERINALMSTYIADSELSQINQSRDTGWHAVDIELATLVEQALTICQQSKGAFDVTVGPLVNLWGFGANDANFQFPNATEINIAMRSIGCQHLDVRLSPPAINKHLSEIYVDLSAIAKGYAVDQLAVILDNHKLNNYMVEIGGEVKAKGVAPHGNPWRIGIETPQAQRSHIEAIISLQDIAVATSGDYRNYFEHEGQRYSHTIDPLNGYPVKHQLASVTVLHESTAMADAWATAFMVLGANESLRLSEIHGLSGLLITRDNDQYQSTSFGNMKNYFTN